MLETRIRWGVFLLAVMSSIALVATSLLTWEYQHDTALLNYAGFMMAEHGAVPYRDLFDTAMPGAFAFHALVAAAGLTGNLGFLALNAVSLAVAGGLAWWALRPVSPFGALLAIPVSIFMALMLGSENLMQRDWLIVLPVTFALGLASRGWPRVPPLRWALIGMMFGLACTIKPQLALAAPIVVILDWALTGPALARGIAAVAWSLVGFAMPVAVVFVWLASAGGLQPFLVILIDYLPLHVEIGGRLDFPEPGLGAPMFDGLWDDAWRRWLLVSIGLAIAIALALLPRVDGRSRAILAALLALLAFYTVIPAMAGQYWLYHFMPAIHFLALTVSLVLVECVRLGPLSVTWVARVLLLGALALYAKSFARPLLAEIGGEAKQGRVAAAAAALDRWRPEGGEVQPIDWLGGGTQHAMLRVEAPLATRYLITKPLNHHVSNDLIKGMRAEFVSALEQKQPAVILVSHQREMLTGWDTDNEIPAFDALLEASYAPVEETSDFSLYLRSDLVNGARDQ